MCELILTLCFLTGRFAVYEEVPPGSEVGRVVAVDADSGALGQVVYSLADSDKSVPHHVLHYLPRLSHYLPCLTLSAMSLTACHVSHTTCHVSHTTCHVSHTVCHVSHTACHVSHCLPCLTLPALSLTLSASPPTTQCLV